jgi:hypothetical protein
MPTSLVHTRVDERANTHKNRDRYVQGYFTVTLKVLQAVCKCCGRILLADKQRCALLHMLQGRRKERGVNKGLHKTILAECKKSRQCPYCLAYNGTVKKMAASFKLLHDPFVKRVRVFPLVQTINYVETKFKVA